MPDDPRPCASELSALPAELNQDCPLPARAEHRPLRVRRTRRLASLAARLALGALLSASISLASFAESGDHVDNSGPAPPAVDPNDPCGVQHAALRESDDFFDRQILQAVLAGAAAGAVIGILTGNWKAALIGVAAGAMAGGVMGYYNEKQKQAAGDQQALAQSIGGDARTYGVAMDKATAAFLALKQCRMAQAAAIKADFAAGRLTRELAQQQLDQVHARFTDELATADHVGAQMNRRQEELGAAADQLLVADPQARGLVAKIDEASANADKPAELARAGIVRDGPGASAKRLAVLKRGDSVVVTGPAQGGWTPVRLSDGRTGFIASQAFKPGTATVHVAKQEDPSAELAAAPPASKAAVETVEVTHSNLKRRDSFGNEVQTAHKDVQVAFNLN